MVLSLFGKYPGLHQQFLKFMMRSQFEAMQQGDGSTGPADPAAVSIHGASEAQREVWNAFRKVRRREM